MAKASKVSKDSKIVILLGSPRKKGNSAALAERVAAGAAARARRQALSRTQQRPANFRATATRATFRPARLRTRW